MKVLLGVCGGIAAYRACDLVRGLREAGHDVSVVMTAAATRFVSPLTFTTLSGRPVGTSLFDETSEEIDHIRLARWPDLVLVAPVTAHTIARFAHGMADDLLSTVVLAAERHVPVLLAPAMNTVMWENPLVQRNMEILAGTERFHVVPPVEKTLACGETGVGGLADETTLLDAVAAHAPGSR
jgi:phosphopantothenoylcysteine decarboxylase/phosphopantothenate--cysteine ligase